MRIQNFFRNQARTLTFLIALVLLLVWMAFVIQVDPRTLWGDQYQLLRNYQGIVEGTQDWGAIWNPKGGHRVPGYYLWFIANIKMTGFHPLFEIIPSIIAFTITVICLTRNFVKSLPAAPLLGGIFSLACLFIFMNGQNLTLSLYSLVAMRLFDFSLFILLAVASYNYLSRSNQNRIFSRGYWTFILVAMIAIPLFGRGWGFATGVSLIVMMLIWLFIHRSKSNPIALKKVMACILPLIFVLAIYLRGVAGLSSHSISQGFDLQAFADFYLKKFGSANIAMFHPEYLREISNVRLDASTPLLEAKAIKDGRLISPMFKFTTYAFSISYLILTAIITLWTLRKHTISKAHWLGLFLLYFPLAAALIVTTSRYKQPAFVIRHNFELSVGISALLYFGFLTLSQVSNRILNTIPYVLATLVIIGSGWTLTQTYRTQNHWEMFYKMRANFVGKSVQENATAQHYKGAQCLNRLSQKSGKKRCEKIFRFIREEKIMPSLTQQD